MLRARERRETVTRRVRYLAWLGGTLFALIAGSYWIVQGVHGAEYRELAEHNRLRKLPVSALRGVVTDVAGRPLAENVPSYTLRIDPSAMRDPARTFTFAGAVLDLPAATLEATYRTRRQRDPVNPVLVAEDLSLAQVARFEVADLEHPEFDIDVEQVRLYRHRDQAAHLLGYIAEVTPEELERASYRRGQLVGRRGLERQYEESLRGHDGERVVVVDHRGRPVEEYGREEARSGQPLRLALDLDLQQAARLAMEGKIGAVVALEPKTGAVKVLLSQPSYDPNLFARRLDARQWQGLVDAPFHPLQNRAIQNAFSPGSVFKPVLALAGLQEGLVTPRDRVRCSGVAYFYNHAFRCWKRGGHGSVDLQEALRQSCDVYFYQLGQELGIDRIGEYARRFGFGAVTGIDLGGERTGLVPGREWSERVRGHPWYPGETISVAIGQGPLLVTPLQMAVMMATVANGGYKPTPHLAADRVVAGARVEGIDSRWWEVVQEGLHQVVERGTGRPAHVPGLEVAGKTGTVQVVSQETWTRSEDLPFEKRDHAWFAAFAPWRDPQLVVVVFVEHGGAGSRAAAPIARALYEEYLAKRSDLRRLSSG